MKVAGLSHGIQASWEVRTVSIPSGRMVSAVAALWPTWLGEGQQGQPRRFTVIQSGEDRGGQWLHAATSEDVSWSPSRL